MPNHITNCVTLIGEEKMISDLRETCFKMEHGKICFDFNGLIPQPENIFLGNLGKKEEIECAEKEVPTWYDWNRKNWGTKWNSYDFVLHNDLKDRLDLQFETAWRTPNPIWDKLKSMGFKLSGFYHDEADNEMHTLFEDEGDWYVSREYHVS